MHASPTWIYVCIQICKCICMYGVDSTDLHRHVRLYRGLNLHATNSMLNVMPNCVNSYLRDCLNTAAQWAREREETRTYAWAHDTRVHNKSGDKSSWHAIPSPFAEHPCAMRSARSSRKPRGFMGRRWISSSALDGMGNSSHSSTMYVWYVLPGWRIWAITNIWICNILPSCIIRQKVCVHFNHLTRCMADTIAKMKNKRANAIHINWGSINHSLKSHT